MVYIGQFSYSDEQDGNPWHGLFTCVVEARNVRAAVQKLRRLVRALAKREQVFEHVEKIYLDACIELKSVPAAGLLAYITVREGEDVGGISSALLGAPPKAASSYSWGREQDESQPVAEVEPFLELRRTPRPPRATAAQRRSAVSKERIH